jgi:hypothetical protein
VYARNLIRLVQAFVEEADAQRSSVLRQRIVERYRTARSSGIRRVLSGLLTNAEDYRAYLRHPDLHLPTTSNAAESFIQCIRDFLYRRRGFRKAPTLLRWLMALAKHKGTITCNGKNSHQPKLRD